MVGAEPVFESLPVKCDQKSAEWIFWKELPITKKRGQIQ